MKRESILQANFHGQARNPPKIVSDDDMAAREAVAFNEVTSFTTYAYDCDVEETEKGKKYHFVSGQQFNESPYRYVGRDKIYTHEDVIAEMEEADGVLKAQASQSDKNFLSGKIDAYKISAEIFRKHDLHPVYIRAPYPALFCSHADPDSKIPVYSYTSLKAGEKVYDTQGKQIWPSSAAPAPAN